MKGPTCWRRTVSERFLGARWDRRAWTLLVIPWLVVSCGIVPQGGSAANRASGHPPASAATPAPPTDPSAYYHFMLGHQAELAQDSERAVGEYRSALQSDPSSVFLKARLASLYFLMGEVADAVRFADQAAEAAGHQAPILTQMAAIYAGAGQTQKALVMYDRAIKQDPEMSEPHISKGLLLANQKRFDEAELAFTEGIARAKDSSVGYYYLGRVGVESKRLDRAVANFERAIGVNPAFEPAYVALASVYESQQERGKAIALYHKYLQAVNPRSKEIRQHLVRMHLGSKAYHEALAELDKILEEDPDDLDAQLRMGLIYGELKDYPKAISSLNQILTVRPDELKVRDYLGLIYEESKDHESAIRAYEHNLKLQPNYFEGHMHLGFLLYRLKRFPDAVSHLTYAVKLSPKQADAHLLLGLTYLQTEQYETASQTFEAGILHNPGNPDLHFNLGTAYDKLNRFDDVVRAMETVLRLDSKHADALNYLGYSYAERGIKIEEAVLLTKRAVSLKPDNGYYVDSLGWAFFKMGLLDEALAEIKRAGSLVGDDPVIFEHLGEIYLKQGLIKDAREAWLRSLELDPSNLKLIERFRERGMGDPTLEERVRQAKRRVTERTSPQQAIP